MIAVWLLETEQQTMILNAGLTLGRAVNQSRDLSVLKTEEPAREDVCRQWDDPGVEVVSYFFHCLSSCAWHELVTLFQNIFSAHVTKCDKQTMFGLTGLKYFHRASVSTFVPPSQSESQIWLLCLSRTEHSASQDNCALYYLPSVYSYSIIN